MQGYELIDFGDGRKLERFGDVIVDRPAPAAQGRRKSRPDCWQASHLVYHRRGDGGEWKGAESISQTWSIQHGDLVLQLRPTPHGQVGAFPEQADNWDWIAARVKNARREIKALNLFAYTGAATLAAASAGAQVTHVDAAKGVVRWARQNARASGLSDASIRWIVEDARTFVAREIRRGNRYDAVILDPPSYGHGPKGRAWKMPRHLGPLVRACGELTAENRAFFLLTCHTPGFGAAELEAIVSDEVFGHCAAGVSAAPLGIASTHGGRLPAGARARWPEV